MPSVFRLVVATLLVASPIRVGAQGTLIFNNRNLTDPVTGGIYHARVTLPDGSGARGSAFTAGLFVVEPGSLRLVFTTTFREVNDVVAGYFAGGGSYVTIPGIPRNSPATLRVRVWETTAGSYDNAVASGRYYGEFATGQPDNNLFIPALGPPPGALPDADLSGIQPLTLVPEPSVWMLFAFGALACLCASQRRGV